MANTAFALQAVALADVLHEAHDLGALQIKAGMTVSARCDGLCHQRREA